MRDRNGDHVAAHDVLADHEQAEYWSGRPWPRYTGYEHLAIGADPGAVFDELHRDCEAPWECYGCGRRVCGRCDPSPAEFHHCVECWTFGGGDVA